MREILFRGKRVDNGEWVYGAVMSANNKTFICELVYEFDEPMSYYSGCSEPKTYHLKRYEVNSQTIGQFIGLIDRDGTKIFEGDIIADNGSGVSKVVFGLHSIDCCGCCYGCHETIGFYFDKYNEDENTFENIKVLGNIFDNPKLGGE